MKKEEWMGQNREPQKEISDMKGLLEEIYGAASAGKDMEEKKHSAGNLKYQKNCIIRRRSGVRGLIDRYRRQRKGI